MSLDDDDQVFDAPIEIFYGNPMTDRKSKFRAYCAKCDNLQDVVLFRDTLLQNGKIAKATHNILAYVTSEDSGYDDDGEAKAGIQVLGMMEEGGAKDCAVMISRWFGGVLLHGDRFRIITGMAQNVLVDNGFMKSTEQRRAEAKQSQADSEPQSGKGKGGKKKGKGRK